MTTLIIDGYIVKEKVDDGRTYLYSAMPDYADEEFYCMNQDNLCFDIDLPIKNLLSMDNPTKCKITIELYK